MHPWAKDWFNSEQDFAKTTTYLHHYSPNELCFQ